MSDWTWAIGTLATGPQRELSQASGRRLTARVDGPFDAQFSCNGLSSDLVTMVRLATDLWIWREGVQVFRGRIGTDSGTIGPTDHTVQFSAVDYRGMLNHRIVAAPGASFTATDQAAIAWSLIWTSQALPGGNWGITNGLGASSGQLRDRTYDPGKPLGDAITELGRVQNGFEWEISPSLALNRWFPLRGTDKGDVIDWGGIVAEVGYGLNSDSFANSVLVTGDEATTPATAVTASIGTDPRGRWERSQGFPTITNQATLADRAGWYAGQTATIRPDYRVRFAGGRWEGPGHVWIGDTVYPAFKSGWISEYGNPHRVVELQMVLDDTGAETVTAGLLAAPT